MTTAEFVLLAVETGILYEVKSKALRGDPVCPSFCDPVPAIRPFVGYFLNSVCELFAKSCQAEVRFEKSVQLQ